MIYTERHAVSGPGLSNFSFPEKEALLVVGDSHGQADALRGMLQGLGRFATPGKRRTLVFLGDFVDRGPDSMGCLNIALNDAADLAGADDVVYLPGNHELLLADTLDMIAEKESDCDLEAATQTWLMNGGMAFLTDFWEKSGNKMPEMKEAIAGLAEALPHPGFDSFSDMVRSWPSHFEMGDVLCIHAGIKPKKPHAFSTDLPQQGHLGNSRWDRGDHARHWAWIRDDFLAWQGGWPRTGDKDDAGSLVIHGHTIPNNLSAAKLEHADDIRNTFSRMTSNARICVDGGAAAGVGVAATLITDEGVRIAHNPT